jgi:hypothetical protein
LAHVLAVLTSCAGAQGLGIDPNSHRPAVRIPLQGDTNADTYRQLPHRDLGSEIHIACDGAADTQIEAPA